VPGFDPDLYLVTRASLVKVVGNGFCSAGLAGIYDAPPPDILMQRRPLARRFLVGSAQKSEL
jgi:hypothetical protein